MKKPSYQDKDSKNKDEAEVVEINFNELTQNIIKEINIARTDPEAYIQILENDKQYFKDNVLYRPNEDPLRTQEGESAHDEAIDFLKSQVALKELTFSEHLSQACLDHVKDIGKTGAVSHEGSNKETISQRLEQYAEWDFVLCQNIDFGGKNVTEIMISFITGDGDSSRTHRKNIFRNDINYIGAASGKHKDTDVVSVIAYAGNIRELGSVAPEIKNFVQNHIKKIEEEKENPKPRKIKTKFQLDDPDAPDNAVSYTTYKKMKLIDGRAKHCTQRVYTLTDGTQHIVEIFDDLKVKCSQKIKNEENTAADNQN